jgi:outer membrane protein
MLATLGLFLSAGLALANSDPLQNVIPEGGVGMGAATRGEVSPYRGAGTRYDLVPVYVYEGEHLYLHAFRVGLKYMPSESHRFDAFISHRFEGSPRDPVPSSLLGMQRRDSGADAGVSYEFKGSLGAVYAEALTNIDDTSRGSEFRLGYRYDWRSGRLALSPYVAVAARDAKLNDYYYGVRPGEATVARPAYAPGSGVNSEIGVYGIYGLSQGWRLVGGVTLTHLAQGIRDSPVVDSRVKPSFVLGLMYDFSPQQKPWVDPKPILMRAYMGKGTECDVAKVIRLVCTSTQTRDESRVYAFEAGRTFVEKLNGWNFDVAGFVGLLYHDERNVISDSWQINAYVKGYWYGFPWRDRVKTRIGMGAGLSYANHIPLLEVRDQQKNGREPSKLLNYLDPTIDVSLGDLLSVGSLKKTYFGLGVSHRSGIFGSSQALGNVSGGSNYIYSYLEWEM